MAQTFPTCDIKDGTIDKVSSRPAWLWPIAQIFTYCIKARARYGFLITEKELVVTRIRRGKPDGSNHEDRHSERLLSRARKPNDPPPEVEDRILDYKRIPWIHNGESRETVNLVLWWLHLMVSYLKSSSPLSIPIEQPIRDSNGYSLLFRF